MHMFASNTNILAQGIEHLNVILLMGLAIFFGTAGARLFRRIRIPQVVGYVVIGLLIGESGLNLIGRDTMEMLSGFNMFALGIIGFMIGGELRKDIFKKHGKQFFIILCSEAITAFLLVALLTGFASWLLTGDIHTSVAMALVLGAIASATAPAATVNVLWENKTRGALTTTVLAIVALDDGLALLLYGLASSVATIFLGQAHGSIFESVMVAVYEILGAVALGVLAGLILGFVLKLIRDADTALAFTVSSVLLVIGLSIALKVGSILAAMTLGVTIANFAPRKKQSTFELVEKFAPPIYVLFFVLAGAHLVLSEIAGWMIVIIIVYVIGRTVGKVIGSWFGAVRSKAPLVVRKYLGFCLLSQAGVAIGLAIISSSLFDNDFGHAIIAIVMATTFIVEMAGPFFVRFGVEKAGEVGLNVTEEDLIATYSVNDMMVKKLPTIFEGTQLAEIIRIFSDTDSFYYPVVDNNKKLMGEITIDGIRNTFATTEANEWLVALDIMNPTIARITPEIMLEDAIETMKKLNIDYLPVVSAENEEFLGVLDHRALNRQLSAEVLERQQKADKMYMPQVT